MKRLGVLLCSPSPPARVPEPPTACGPIGEVTVNAGETATVDACFTDPNGDALAYSIASSNPEVATATMSGADVTIAAVAPGGSTVTVTASDPGGLKAEQSFQVAVPNRAPEAGDPIPDTETYATSSSDTAVATVSVADSVVSVAAVSAGSATLTVTATDPGGLSARTTVPLRAGDATRLTNHSESDTYPAWSPDTSRIAYSGWPGRYLDIYVMDADGSDMERLTDNSAYDVDPAWSPDGARIVFASAFGGNFDSREAERGWK